MTDLGSLDEVVCVQGESFVISGPTGAVRPGRAHGLYVRDTRFLSRLTILVDGVEPAPLAGASVGGHHAVFHAYLPPSSDTEVDPTVSLTHRRVVDGGLREEIDVANAGSQAVTMQFDVVVGADFAYIFDVKHGRPPAEVEPEPDGDLITFRREDGNERTVVHVSGARATGDVLRSELRVEPGHTVTVVIGVSTSDPNGDTCPPPATVGLPGTSTPERPGPPGPQIACSAPRFSRLVRRSVTDLASLGLRDPMAAEDRYPAAGSPWFLTLFGRDSIWAALMALPHDPELARGTLRVLARRQGTRVDAVTEEEPGKILHEVRHGAMADRGDLPPFYYGSVDATPLFVVLAHEAWCWGLADADLEPLLDNVEAAMEWMRTYGDPDGDGFIEYVKHEGRSLANQGWKDSHDGIRFADGRIAEAPLALCEVQGYAYEAAVRGAALLDHFGRPGGDAWRTWAAGLADRFRAAFWVGDERGRYPAVALDHAKNPVDGVASNIGHLLSTGLLDAQEKALVAGRLGSPDMASGWGLRTMSADTAGFNPLSYHCGSVWPHDTAIAVWGLARSGHGETAAALLDGLVRAGPTFGFRLPELFSGFPRQVSELPVPYPTACRPQAWAAGGVLLLVRALLGAEADLPNGRLVLRPMAPAPFERLELLHLPLGEGSIDIRLRHGELDVITAGTDVEVVVEG